jgi:hypothetical protein
MDVANLALGFFHRISSFQPKSPRGAVFGALSLIFSLLPAPIGQSAPNSALSTAQFLSAIHHGIAIRRLAPNGSPLIAPSGQQESNNWSGYVFAPGTYTSAAATFVVPTLSYAPYSSGPTFEFSSTWVGIGGWVNSTDPLIQIGIVEGVAEPSGNTPPVYQAFYQRACPASSPDPSLCDSSNQLLPTGQYPVSAGDIITASLSCSGAACSANPQTWVLSMTNPRWAQPFTITLPFESSFLSAEWIMEASTLPDNSISPLPNYNSATFGGLTANGANVVLSAANGIVKDEDKSPGLSTPCPPNTGSEFVVVYGTATNCPQNTKLVGTGYVGAASEGYSVALSADGNTAIVGGQSDDGNIGAAWIFTRGAGLWALQTKLVGTGYVGAAGQGRAVALSADGNTAIIGGPYDNGYIGAAWVFTRSGSTWTQQAKLVPTGGANQGFSVALSGDGNTALLGAPATNENAGVVFVFTRTDNSWTQQAKLVGTGAVNPPNNGAQQGWAVALSGDGNTALEGSIYDNDLVGAAWVFSRSGSIWSQQAKLVGANAVGQSLQGNSVALSADGNTALIGGPGQLTNVGEAWVFNRSGSVWSQQGPAFGGQPGQAFSVGLSADGNTAILGQPGINATTFIRNGGLWIEQGQPFTVIGTTDLGWSVALSATANIALVGDPNDNSGAGEAWLFVPQNLPPSASPLLAAVLPESRSAQPGGTVTAFATIINTSTSTLPGCFIAPATSMPATFVYQTTDPTTNALTGTPNTPVSIPGNNQFQTFVIAFTPSAAIVPTNVPFLFSCTETNPAPVNAGLNTLLLSASTTPTPDVIALGATLQNDGIVHVTNGSPPTGVFAVATDNLGSGDTITVATNTGTASLPIAVTVCQTNPTTGACLQPVSATVATTISSNTTPTFAVFVSASGNVPFDPTNNRIFVTFTDSSGAVRGETSVAVETQ